MSSCAPRRLQIQLDAKDPLSRDIECHLMLEKLASKSINYRVSGHDVSYFRHMAQTISDAWMLYIRLVKTWREFRTDSHRVLRIYVFSPEDVEMMYRIVVKTLARANTENWLEVDLIWRNTVLKQPLPSCLIRSLTDTNGDLLSEADDVVGILNKRVEIQEGMQCIKGMFETLLLMQRGDDKSSVDAVANLDEGPFVSDASIMCACVMEIQTAKTPEQEVDRFVFVDLFKEHLDTLLPVRCFMNRPEA